MKIIQIFLALCLLCFSAFNLNAQENKEVKTTKKEAQCCDFKYKFGSGDKLKITVFNEADLSGEFEISGTGMISFPLIGNIKAGGLDSEDLEHLIVKQLKGDYLINPRVNIEVLNFRPFFILGEVNSPGSYPYVNGLTVMNAVALAGGYTHRARTSKFIVTRIHNNKKKKKLTAKEGDMVAPGDTIRVTERLF